MDHASHSLEGPPLASWGIGMLVFEILTLTIFPFGQAADDITLDDRQLAKDLRKLHDHWVSMCLLLHLTLQC